MKTINAIVLRSVKVRKSTLIKKKPLLEESGLKYLMLTGRDSTEYKHSSYVSS
jgi:hypothetical protein